MQKHDSNLAAGHHGNAARTVPAAAGLVLRGFVPPWLDEARLMTFEVLLKCHKHHYPCVSYLWASGGEGNICINFGIQLSLSKKPAD
jgi:hypothetical protein